MNTIIKRILFTILIFSLFSCEDWLSVTPKSEIREEDHYSTIGGFQESLIGCYLGMTDENLYGKYLSWHLLEYLGNQFEPNSSTTEVEYYLQRYDYGQLDVINISEAVWAKAYNVIANANEALKYIEQNKNVLDDINYHIIKGELLGIRAYLHFDLLRLYGYGNLENRHAELADKKIIPYSKSVSKTSSSSLTSKEVIDNILADLLEAESLLVDYDPITGKHETSYYNEVNIDGFFNDRTLRLNYYAIKALHARVLLWEGSDKSKSEALSIALNLIEIIAKGGVNNKEMYTSFSYLDANVVSVSNASLNSENFFNLYVNKLPSYTNKYVILNYTDTDKLSLYIKPNEAFSIYETYSEDVRFSKLLQQNFNSSSMGYVPVKLYQTSNIKKISMFRVPEIYYIAAECYATISNPDLLKAQELLNYTRGKRGVFHKLENLSKDQILEEIGKEYHKEFLSEGVMFYYYKRTGAISVPHFTGTMTDEQYNLPRPDFEN